MSLSKAASSSTRGAGGVPVPLPGAPEWRVAVYNVGVTQEEWGTAPLGGEATSAAKFA